MRSAFCNASAVENCVVKSKAERSIAKRKIKIDQNRALLALLHQRDGKVAGHRGNARAAFAAEKDQDLSTGLF